MYVYTAALVIRHDQRIFLHPIVFSSVAYLALTYFTTLYHTRRGPGSSVGTATDYGLDGSGSNPGGEEIFRPS